MEGSGGQQHSAGDPSAFNLMISQMLSPQNEQRRAAEALFGEAKKQGDYTASSLVALLRQSPQVDVRALCAVLLRKVRRRAGADVLDRPARARRGADGAAPRAQDGRVLDRVRLLRRVVRRQVCPGAPRPAPCCGAQAPSLEGRLLPCAEVRRRRGLLDAARAGSLPGTALHAAAHAAARRQRRP